MKEYICGFFDHRGIHYCGYVEQRETMRDLGLNALAFVTESDTVPGCVVYPLWEWVSDREEAVKLVKNWISKKKEALHME